MIILLASSKTMDFTNSYPDLKFTNKSPFADKIWQLANFLKALSDNDLKIMMNIKDRLLNDTKLKINSFSFGQDKEKLKPAIFSFSGEVFKSIDIKNFSNDDIRFCNEKTRILSGLYGLLSPLTLIEAYRLEMGYKINFEGFKKASDFWKEAVTQELNRLIEKEENKYFINLASNEYIASIDKKNLNKSIIDIVFKDRKNGSLKSIAVYAKRARGMMLSYIIKNRIDCVEDLKNFNEDGYFFDPDLSHEKNMFFVR